VRGTISGTWSTVPSPTGDYSDAFAFDVPAGLALTGIQIIVTNYSCTNCSSSASSSNAGITAAAITGNGTFTMPVTGSLPAGTYRAQVRSLFATAGTAGAGSFNYEFRITIGLANDSCELPTTIGLGATAFNNTTATTDGPATVGCGGDVDANGIGHDLWYQYIPSLSGIVTADTCGASFDTAIVVYTGACGSLTQVACNDDDSACGGNGMQSRLSFTAAAGTAYLIRVAGYSTNSGTGTLTLSLNTTGACCNHSTGGCLVLPQADCQTFGGTFLGFGAACSPANCIACPADFNNSGTVSVQDIFDFLAAYFAGCP
jgi:hypothetical protein